MEKTPEKLLIWGKNIPYNTGKSKLEIMALKKTPVVPILTYLKFARNIGRKFVDDPEPMNEVTYHYEIKTGDAKETFDDEPYLIPFLSHGSDRAIIVLPGGGYANKMMDGEGIKVAQFLNEAGISSFVLWYRLNPYRAPVPFLDLQRAVRYLKYHAKTYGIDPEKVGVAGFSAGGHNCAMLVNVIRNCPVDYPGYIPDEIDAVDARVALAGLFYPAIDLSYNPGILFALAEPDMVRNEKTRLALIDQYNPTLYVQPNDPPQFLGYGTKDTLVDPKGLIAYKAALDQAGVPNLLFPVKGVGHGFAPMGFVDVLKSRFTEPADWRKAFTQWANEIFEER